MLEKEFTYYIEHQEELVKKYNKRVLVIIGEKVVADYETEEKAYFESAKKYKVGTFLIQKCTPGKESYTQSFYSRVIFA
ncbi:MAG: hypothetical protein JJE45_07690 [Prolixibacteraceae bacterium]|nr:hypothetical protein [Prolixibacteraceae bacterium]